MNISTLYIKTFSWNSNFTFFQFKRNETLSSTPRTKLLWALDTMLPASNGWGSPALKSICACQIEWFHVEAYSGPTSAELGMAPDSHQEYTEGGWGWIPGQRLIVKGRCGSSRSDFLYSSPLGVSCMSAYFNYGNSLVLLIFSVDFWLLISSISALISSVSFGYNLLFVF